MSYQELIIALRNELSQLGISTAGSAEYYNHAKQATFYSDKIRKIELSYDNKIASIGNYKTGSN